MNAEAPVVVLDAAAGTGKSWLLADLSAQTGLPIWRGESPPDGDALWDVPPVAVTGAIPEQTARLILAKRPDTAIPGLARAEVYGRVQRFVSRDLLFDAAGLEASLGLAPAAAARVIERTGGWGCLLPASLGKKPDSKALVAFLSDEVLEPIDSARLVALDIALDGGAVPAQALRGIPFAQDGLTALPQPLAACRAPLRRALSDILAARGAGSVEQARAIAMARAAHGQIPAAIAIFQSIGAWQTALDYFRRAHGPFSLYMFGPEAFDRMIAAFPPEIAARDDFLVVSRAIQAIKRGEQPLARRIVQDRFGPEADDIHAVFDNPYLYNLDFRFFRFLLQTWQDFDLDQPLLDKAYHLLAELPADDDLRRGAFYNAALEFYIRDRRFAEADHTAVLAASHYARSDVPILSFYIDLHRAIIQLLLGDPGAARKHATSAAAKLASAAYDSPGDSRLLALLDACIAYEGGTAEPLTRFLAEELDELAHGEIWPTLVELVLIYGSQALGEHFSTMAARGFLDRWRVRDERSSQFGKLIDIREVFVMQNGNRWQEAMARASAMRSDITLGWVEAAGENLNGLKDRDDVALALVWLRHIVQVAPTRPGLDRQIEVMLDNPHLTGRQRIGAEIWLAYVMRRQRRVAEAQVQLRKTLSTAANLGCIATLSEERVFLAELTRTRRLREGLERTPTLRRLLRQVQETGPGRVRRGKAHGLTRQEMRILHTLAEGATNKMIANLMELSEATVKFHLSNLYRKLGCSSRREAVAAAQALRLVT